MISQHAGLLAGSLTSRISELTYVICSVLFVLGILCHLQTFLSINLIFLFRALTNFAGFDIIVLCCVFGEELCHRQAHLFVRGKLHHRQSHLSINLNFLFQGTYKF